MNQETKHCQNCKNEFRIEPEDFVFYEKIEVPPPTFCPECRFQRRLMFRNERTLYKRMCDLCEKDVISIYSGGTKFPVYCHECWFSDKWSSLDFGKGYDFSQTFIEQFNLLQEKVPRIAIFNTQCVNSEYTNQSYNNKNAYLSFALRDSEDCAYVTKAIGVKNCLDITYTHHSEYIYESIYVDKSYKSKFLEESESCIDSALLSNCRNCQNCIGGINLRAASCYFFGEKLSKEDFKKKAESLEWGSYQAQEKLKGQFSDSKAKGIHKFAQLTNCADTKGDHVSNGKNCHYVFDGFDLENARHSSWVFKSKDISDAYGMGGSELIYEAIGVEEVNNIKFANVSDTTNNAQYIDLCFSSHNLFGCIGLRSKSYCILNKQYTKEAYEKMVAKIIEYMNVMPYSDVKRKTYKYGEFFPPELSPFCYNETIAQEYFPLTKEEAIGKGYSWKDREIRDYKVTIQSKDLPDHIRDVNDAILEEVIGCEHKGVCQDQCTEVFKIIPQELDLYRKMSLPLPRLCPNCRYYQRLKQRNPLKLLHRTCQCGGTKSENGVYKNTIEHFHEKEHCPNEFETSYSLERKEIVYCESCYNKEII